MVDYDSRDNENDIKTYSIIPSGVFSASPREQNLNLGFSASNIVEIKYYSKRDSIAKKYKLTNFNFSTGYNFVRDSLKLSSPTLSGRSSFFKNRSSLNYGFAWDPYQVKNGRNIDKYVWEDGFVLPNLSNMTIRTTTRLKFSEIRGWINGKESPKVQKGKKPQKKNVQMLSLGELFDNFTIEYKLDYSYKNTDGVVSSGISANTINVRGNIEITDNWSLNLGNFGYDFFRNGYSYPDFGFSRNLHCWVMTFSWQPQGASGFNSSNTSTFNFNIRANSSTLEFLKYDYRKGNFDL